MIDDIKFIPYKVLTHNKGIIPIEDVSIGDTLIEYGTNAPLKIIDTECVQSTRPYIVKFNDGRELILQETDFTFKLLNHKMSLYRKQLSPRLYSNVIQFSSKLRKPVSPDPYIAGAGLFANKDMDIFGIPVNKYTYNNQFKWTYNATYDRYVKDHLIVFEDTDTSSLFTWYKMFPYGTNLNQYKYGRVLDRMRFVRGAFDVGYDPVFSTSTIAITHKDKATIELLQWILWSLGVTSKIITKSYLGGDIFILSLIGEFSAYPGFFYNVEEIERVGAKVPHDSFLLDIDYIEPYQNPNILQPPLHYIFHTEKEHASYLTPNFLYMIS